MYECSITIISLAYMKAGRWVESGATFLFPEIIHYYFYTISLHESWVVGRVQYHLLLPRDHTLLLLYYKLT